VPVITLCVNGAMKAIGTLASLALVFGAIPGLAFAAAPQPLRLELPALSTSGTQDASPRSSAFTRSMEPRSGRAARIAPLFSRDGTGPRAPAAHPDLQGRARDLGRQALRTVLDQDAIALDEQRADGRMQLKFQKRGNAFRDFNKGYREMCDKVSQKIWDDPNGKRIRFDVAGKPGVAFEIPVGHH
jgi:hypothetical protein